MPTSLSQGPALLRIQRHSSLQESSCKLCISGIGGEGSFALYHPPLLHNLQAEMSADGSGLTAVFQAMCAGDEGWHPLEKMKNPTFLSYRRDEMKPDEMQASDEDLICEDEPARIEINRLKVKKTR